MKKYFNAKILNDIKSKLIYKTHVRSQSPLGWTFLRKDFSFIFEILPGLKFKEGYALRAYRYVDRNRKSAQLKFWAVPDNECLPQPEECMFSEDKHVSYPKPDCVLENVILAIDGDLYFDSYISSSILFRTITDARHYSSEKWGLNIIIDDNLMEAADLFDSDKYIDQIKKDASENILCGEEKFLFTNLSQFNTDDWKWKIDRYGIDWRPTVEIENDIVKVTFYTYYGHGKKTIYKNTDLFNKGSYTFESSKEKIAEGGEGYLI